jgi:TonB-dependent SusC/RagA subfamily outer membrane receptor
VSGVVSSDLGTPLPGVQITIPSLGVGNISGADGRYLITRVPAGTHRLRAQRLGFQAREQEISVTAGQTTTANLTLVSAPTTLAEQVIVGYTTEQRRDITGAVASVSGTELQDQKVATIEEALRGRAPGVTVAGSGEPGRPSQIIIRGQNGFGTPSPLYVVDGMYLTENPNLNPDDIESVEVLKDASAAAQYGAQASNGVVVIRTRHGHGTVAGVEHAGVPERRLRAGRHSIGGDHDDGGQHQLAGRGVPQRCDPGSQPAALRRHGGPELLRERRVPRAARHDHHDRLPALQPARQQRRAPGTIQLW